MNIISDSHIVTPHALVAIRGHGDNGHRLRLRHWLRLKHLSCSVISVALLHHIIGQYYITTIAMPHIKRGHCWLLPARIPSSLIAILRHIGDAIITYPRVTIRFHGHVVTPSGYAHSLRTSRHFEPVTVIMLNISAVVYYLSRLLARLSLFGRRVASRESHHACSRSATLLVSHNTRRSGCRS